MRTASSLSASRAPYIEIYNDQPPFEMPLVHPFDPMSMWASTQREMQHMPKDRRLPRMMEVRDGTSARLLTA